MQNDFITLSKIIKLLSSNIKFLIFFEIIIHVIVYSVNVAEYKF